MLKPLPLMATLLVLALHHADLVQLENVLQRVLLRSRGKPVFKFIEQL